MLDVVLVLAIVSNLCFLAIGCLSAYTLGFNAGRKAKDSSNAKAERPRPDDGWNNE